MGAGDYSMRIWLDPEAMRIRNLSADQVYAAIQAQNMEVSAGNVGQPFGRSGNNAFQYTLNVKGRLTTPDEFGEIILRVEDGGRILRLKDVARIELGSQKYNVVSRLEGKPTAGIAVYQLPGSNSLDVAKGVKARMEELAEAFPKGIHYAITLDTTEVVHDSINEVMKTFIEATISRFGDVLLLAELAGGVDSLYNHSCITYWYFGSHGSTRFLYQYVDLVRFGFGHCHCGR